MYLSGHHDVGSRVTSARRHSRRSSGRPVASTERRLPADGPVPAYRIELVVRVGTRPARAEKTS
jgi:hypothetical protein